VVITYKLVYTLHTQKSCLYEYYVVLSLLTLYKYMSYQNAQRMKASKKHWVFSGWYVDNVQNVDLAPHYSPYLRNARLDGQSIIIRPWHSLFATLTTWDYPRWIWSYLRTDPANDRIVVRHNTDATHKLYSLTTAGVATSVSTAGYIASDNRMEFQNVEDVIYCMNGSDDFGKLSWTTYTTPSTWISDFSPSFSVVFNSSHRVSGWSDNSNKVYKSVWDNYEDFNSSWSDDFTFKETVTWLSANLEALFYFTKNTISVTGATDIQDTAGTATYTTRSLEVKEWATNHASIVEAGSKTFFLTPSNKISIIARGQIIDWFEVLELSERPYNGISKIMNTLDIDQTDSFGYFLPKDNLIKRHLKTEWATFNDICIVYDLTKDAFLVDTQKFFYGWIHFKWLNYTISMLEEKVYKDESGNDDEDSPTPFEYRTKEYYISDPTYKKILWESRTLLDINELASLTQTIWIDWQQIDTKTVWVLNVSPTIVWWIGISSIWEESIWEEWSTNLNEWDDDYYEIYILRTKGNLNEKWRKIQFRYTNNTVAGKARLKDLNMKVEVLSEIATNLTT